MLPSLSQGDVKEQILEPKLNHLDLSFIVDNAVFKLGYQTGLLTAVARAGKPGVQSVRGGLQKSQTRLSN